MITTARSGGDVKLEVETGSPRHRAVERHLVAIRSVTLKDRIEKVYAFLTDPKNTSQAESRPFPRRATHLVARSVSEQM